MEDMALQAMASAAIASSYNSNPITSSSFNQTFTPSTSFVKEILNETSNSQLIHTSVAFVLPNSITPFVLGTGASNTESDPSLVSPISVLHYIWNAKIHGISEFPTPISCLLDNSTHSVLIRPETVADLGLKIFKLHTLQTASIAIDSQHHTFHLANYVILSLSLLNNAWTSCPIRTLITADLCVNILLGLPFLKHNKIVIDHDADTAIAKDSNFDLLNENSFILPKKPPPS